MELPTSIELLPLGTFLLNFLLLPLLKILMCIKKDLDSFKLDVAQINMKVEQHQKSIDRFENMIFEEQERRYKRLEASLEHGERRHHERRDSVFQRYEKEGYDED